MKLTGRDAARFFQAPDTGFSGLLLFGQDAMRVAERRQQVIAALIGPNGDAEMRLTRIPGAELRKTPALLLDAVKAQGFFPGPRVAFVIVEVDADHGDVRCLPPNDTQAGSAVTQHQFRALASVAI